MWLLLFFFLLRRDAMHYYAYEDYECFFFTFGILRFFFLRILKAFCFWCWVGLRGEMLSDVCNGNFWTRGRYLSFEKFTLARWEIAIGIPIKCVMRKKLKAVKLWCTNIKFYSSVDFSSPLMTRNRQKYKTVYINLSEILKITANNTQKSPISRNMVSSL